MLAKWLIGDARVFLFDEPTRGIDVGAKAEIYALMLQLLARGAAIVMVSSELARSARDVASHPRRARRKDRGRIRARRRHAGKRHRRRRRGGGVKRAREQRRARTGCAVARRGRGCSASRSSRSSDRRIARTAFLAAEQHRPRPAADHLQRILGVGQTFVIITAGIDLSVGSLVALTGVVMALFANAMHLSGFPLIAATLVVGLARRLRAPAGQRATGRAAQPAAVHHDARDDADGARRSRSCSRTAGRLR